MPQRRQYRDDLTPLLPGMVFTIAPLIIAGSLLVKIAAHQPITFRYGRGDLVGHQATALEIALVMLMPQMLTFLGVILLIGWGRSGVYVDEVGLTKVRTTGKVMCQMVWSEVHSLDRYKNNRGQWILCIKSPGKVIEFNESSAVRSGLAQNVRGHIPHIEAPNWPQLRF